MLDRQARDPRLDRIKRAVDGAGESGLTRSAISGLFSRNLTKEVLGELLTELTRMASTKRPAWPPRGDLQKRTGEFCFFSFVPKGRPDDE